ncbi:DUF3318 domain-containing protein [Vacuolonema iberomarrocanum]|uniref:DUF3318 domain-containing protein n=1 Tax=Vacuolonema iberomarrocanum TaxID=3454632 RepID=UPI001A031E1F|nr:DUF3318 domain-containing protein [filamentous cyanobacterium LEGE 07170]
MNPDIEIARLLDIMPASGRMYGRLINQPNQSRVLSFAAPRPWDKTRPIYINFELWDELPRPQRDILLIRTINWMSMTQWFKLDWQRGVAIAGVFGGLVELAQGDAIGVMIAGGLTGWAGWQIWKENRSSQREIAADEDAIRFALRRGYSEQEAARHLIGAIENTAKIENRFSLDFIELLRCQNLRAIAGLSNVPVPDDLR